MKARPTEGRAGHEFLTLDDLSVHNADRQGDILQAGGPFIGGDHDFL
jgi:hypothetical protein